MDKYIYSFITAFLAFSLVSCEKGDPVQEIPPVEEIEIYALIGDMPTKSSIGREEMADGKAAFPVIWDKGDAIAVINNGKLYKFSLEEECANTSKGKFKIDKSALPPNFKEGDFNPDMAIQAFYPYDGIRYDTILRSISYHVPLQQEYRTVVVEDENGGTATAGNLTRGALPMAAYVANAKDTIGFMNLFGVLKLSISGDEGEKLESITVISENIINGDASVSIDMGYGGTSYCSIDIFGSKADDDKTENKRVVLICGDGEPLSSTSKDFLIALPDRTYDYGVLITTSKGIYYKAISIPHVSVNIIESGEVLKVSPLNTNEMAPAYMENGVFLGDGIELPKSADGEETIVWAPVNCGYEEPKKDGGQIIHIGYPYGKLYQWGRKDGQGYKDNSYEDASYPSEAYILGTGTPEPEKFYFDWTAGGVAEWPSDADPCPEGWRVPTNEELLSLLYGLAPNDYLGGLAALWVTSNGDTKSRHYGLPGFTFYGNTVGADGNCLFLPAAGFRNYDFMGAHVRGLSGCYWSASSNGPNNAWYMDFNRNGYVDSYYAHRAYGRSVRCVMK